MVSTTNSGSSCELARMDANGRLAPPTTMPAKQNRLRSDSSRQRHTAMTVENACLDTPLRQTSRSLRASLESAPTGPPGASTAASDEASAMVSTTNSGSVQNFHRRVVAQLQQVAGSARMPASAADNDRSSPPSPQASDATPNSGPPGTTRTALSARMEANDRLAPPRPRPTERWTRRHDPSHWPTL